MKRVTGLGGLFFKSDDPEKLYQWYEKHLGIARAGQGPVLFNWRETEDPARTGTTVWAVFPRDSKYFDPSRAGFMMNFRVADLDGLLKKLRTEGIEVDSHSEDSDYGGFAWIMDPDGNRIELWEPPASVQPTKRSPKKSAVRSKPKSSRKKPPAKKKRH